MTRAAGVPTRKQRQEHTRRCLLDAAARVFARRGLAQASVDEVAADAGFTKGAVYANFASKEELFLEMMDVRFAARLAELDRALSTDEAPVEQARAAGRDFVEHLNLDPEWSRLFIEAGLHASRDATFRAQLLPRYAAMRERMAELLRRRGEAGGLDPGVPYEQLATMVLAMANGVAFERLVQPDTVPDELFSSMLGLFTIGAAGGARAPR
ncbi:TetR/AcrR family transcriptional regulator [Baekduia soli]|uniref:TetR/AcrR family transcriptional regulator n=1 Tax=Baekduia soli TaxID=496014 RepID=A0A5B8U0T8_9ACTN|nr:TetR/AcrR family transcriptional regulator [Baekduia soli]QEC46597.1 TetR/AcrR family transcriptional regulator [Baekduia soli]